MDTKSRLLLPIGTALLLCLAWLPLDAQRGGGAPPAAARESAAIDLTGYWVSVITEDWKFRMVTPRRGVSEPIPVNAEARRIGDTWDPGRDDAAGDACRAYGAANIMRMPGRLRITWQDANTLRIDTDAGTQTRLFHFAAPPAAPAERTWQGVSVAQWRFAPGGRSGGRGGSLKVITTNLRPGYVRRNGVPHSDQATVTEYFDVHALPNGDRWMTITTRVTDPQSFTTTYTTTTDFKRVADDTGWTPTPCSAR